MRVKMLINTNQCREYSPIAKRLWLNSLIQPKKSPPNHTFHTCGIQSLRRQDRRWLIMVAAPWKFEASCSSSRPLYIRVASTAPSSVALENCMTLPVEASKRRVQIRDRAIPVHTQLSSPPNDLIGQRSIYEQGKHEEIHDRNDPQKSP